MSAMFTYQYNSDAKSIAIVPRRGPRRRTVIAKFFTETENILGLVCAIPKAQVTVNGTSYVGRPSECAAWLGQGSVTGISMCWWLDAMYVAKRIRH